MKLYFCPSFNNTTYINFESHGGILWDEAVVGTSALLEQLLLRTGLTQVAAEEIEARTELRRKSYKEHIQGNCNWISGAMAVDPDGTVDKILEWRDCLVMEGWTPNMTKEASSDKLKSLSQWEDGYDSMSCPGRADLWQLLYEKLQTNPDLLQQSDLEVDVRIPQVLVPKLIVKVLEKVAKVTYSTYDETELKTENRSIFQVREQYEAWQYAALQNLDSNTMVVCEDVERLNNTLKGLRGEKYNISNAGCLHPSDDITNQLDTPKKIVWIDCDGSKRNAYRFGFLTLEEINCLANKGLQLPSAEEISQAYMQWVISLINKAEKVELWVPHYQETELLSEHPVVTELKYRGVSPCNPTGFTPPPPPPIHTFTPELEILLDPTHIANLPKPNDSASTLEKLYQRPFDFFTEKMAGLRAPEDDSDENIFLQKGKVAHYVVEMIVNENPGNLTAMKGCFSTNYYNLLDDALQKEGSLLQEDENKNDLAIFKEELKESIQTLFDIITNLGLTPQQCEHEFKIAMDSFINAHGYIDMILTDKNGKNVIIDLKYSSSNRYSNALKENQSLQLTYYEHALVAEKKDVVWSGYYQLPLKTLYVKKGSLTSPVPDNVEEVPINGRAPSDADYWNSLNSTYNARMDEIMGGRIEEGEGFDESNFTGKSDTFVDIDKDKNKGKNVKKTAFSKYPSDEDYQNRPTTHTILKNHLK